VRVHASSPPPDAQSTEPTRGELIELVIITGFSGAGKSTAMNVFEDAGYFCVDNLPPEMIRGLVDVFAHEGAKVERAAVVSDVRGRAYFEHLRDVLAELVRQGLPHRLLFLDADEQSLLNRYKETRRRHPLAPNDSVLQGIARERELLAPIRAQADAVVDTSDISAAELRRQIADTFLPRSTDAPLAVTFSSFGFKHGPPRDADLTFDVRFLPNPHWEPSLRPLTGQDPRVVEYVQQDGHLAAFYGHLEPLLDFLLPQYEAEGKAHLSVAIGCTGGKHRSVAITEHLSARYGERDDLRVSTVHRDLERALRTQ
jgi:RNase adapter protein RapZ